MHHGPWVTDGEPAWPVANKTGTPPGKSLSRRGEEAGPWQRRRRGPCSSPPNCLHLAAPPVSVSNGAQGPCRPPTVIHYSSSVSKHPGTPRLRLCRAQLTAPVPSMPGGSVTPGDGRTAGPLGTGSGKRKSKDRGRLASWRACQQAADAVGLSRRNRFPVGRAVGRMTAGGVILPSYQNIHQFLFLSFYFFGARNLCVV